MFQMLRALQDSIEVALLKCLWTFVFLCAIGFNLFVSITGFRPGAQPSSSDENDSSGELSSWLKNKYNLTGAHTSFFFPLTSPPIALLISLLSRLSLVLRLLRYAMGTYLSSIKTNLCW